MVLPGNHIFHLLEQGTSIRTIINEEERELRINDFRMYVIPIFEHVMSDIATLAQSDVKTSIDPWYDIIRKISTMAEESSSLNPNDFYVYVYDDESKYQRKAMTSNRKLGFWCFNAASGMRELKALGPRSILLTSGTLSPLDSFQQEMGIGFKTLLENPHVINKK